MNHTRVHCFLRAKLSLNKHAETSLQVNARVTRAGIPMLLFLSLSFPSRSRCRYAISFFRVPARGIYAGSLMLFLLTHLCKLT